MTLQTPFHPVEVSDVQMAFPGSVLRIMPAKEDIPEEFWESSNEWNKIASSWVFNGLPATVKFHLRDGIDGGTMMRHLHTILGSYEPQHEHKEAAVAFLLSQWCVKVKGWKK